MQYRLYGRFDRCSSAVGSGVGFAPCGFPANGRVVCVSGDVEAAVKLRRRSRCGAILRFAACGVWSAVLLPTSGLNLL